MNRWNNGRHCRTVCCSIVFALGLATLGAAYAVPVHAPDRNKQADETARTSQGVIAVDDHWSRAELTGDTAWLNSMLLPDYRSIDADGRILDRKTLLAHAAKNLGSDKMKKFDTWLKTHPFDESVIIRGNVAILSFSNPHTGRIKSSDVFVYQGGGWHALYSQHSKAE